MPTSSSQEEEPFVTAQLASSILGLAVLFGTKELAATSNDLLLRNDS
jgi:hypothetical protein